MKGGKVVDRFVCWMWGHVMPPFPMRSAEGAIDVLWCRRCGKPIVQVWWTREKGLGFKWLR